MVGLLTSLAIATRTGGIFTHAYLLGAMILCVGEFWARNDRLTPRYIMQIKGRDRPLNLAGVDDAAAELLGGPALQHASIPSPRTAAYWLKGSKQKSFQPSCRSRLPGELQQVGQACTLPRALV